MTYSAHSTVQQTEEDEKARNRKGGYLEQTNTRIQKPPQTEEDEKARNGKGGDWGEMEKEERILGSWPGMPFTDAYIYEPLSSTNDIQ